MASAQLVSLARRLKAARALSGKKVPELAAEIGVSKRTYWRLESGDRVPDALELESIASATGQSIEFFYESPSAVGEPTVTRPRGSVKAVRS